MNLEVFWSALGALYNHLFARRLAIFNNQLQRNLTKDTTLHAKRVEITAKMFTDAVDLDRALSYLYTTYYHLDSPDIDQVPYDNLHSKAEAFKAYIELNRVYFEDATINALENFWADVDNCAIYISGFKTADDLRKNNRHVMDDLNKVTESFKAVEKQFKIILGVKT